MGKFDVDGQQLSIKHIAREDAESVFVLIIEYIDDGERHVSEVTLDAEKRGEVTTDLVAGELRSWNSAHKSARITDYRVEAHTECKSGRVIGTRVSREATEEPTPGVDADELDEGMLVAYYVGGPESNVYGHISEGEVVEPVADESSEAVLNIGKHEKRIPHAWIVGSVKEDFIAEAVDRPREELH